MSCRDDCERNAASFLAGVLQCVLQGVAGCRRVLQGVAGCCRVLQCVAVRVTLQEHQDEQEQQVAPNHRFEFHLFIRVT